jgi:hypothetical protein
MTFSYESMSRASPSLVSDWSKPSGSNFSFGIALQNTVAERYRRLIVIPLHLRKSSQAFVRPVLLFKPSSQISTRAFSTSSPNQHIRF